MLSAVKNYLFYFQSLFLSFISRLHFQVLFLGFISEFYFQTVNR